MKHITSIVLLIAFNICLSQSPDKYFEKIRNNSAELTAFFSQMPKGGDLHHHYSGSVYAETYINYVIGKNYLLNKKTFEVSDKEEITNDWAKFSILKNEGTLEFYKQKLIQKWSVKDYNNIDQASEKFFFETFSNFEIAAKANIDSGLLELKHRAIKENVSYIETILLCAKSTNKIKNADSLNVLLGKYNASRDEEKALRLMSSLYKMIYEKEEIDSIVKSDITMVSDIHKKMKVDDSLFTMRYQTFVIRTVSPFSFFKRLIVAFETAVNSKLIVGVNIVGAEDNEVSLRDYWLHMLMFKYCHSKYPMVKYAIHAGELTLGYVKPEELTWHINSAVYLAGANRVGHGVDVVYEDNNYTLLKHMSKNNIPVEINLFSNEFILKVKEDRHPIMLYRFFHVPILICTDDAGVLRTNLIDQYVLMAKRYKEISYAEIKGYVYNSIKYSFIENETLKSILIKDLDRRFIIFEKSLPMQN